MTTAKDIKKLQRKAVAQGWRIKKTAHHYMWLSPDGRTTVTVGCSESDWRSLANTLSRLKKAGFVDA